MKINQLPMFHAVWEEIQKNMNSILNSSEENREGVEQFVNKCQEAIDGIRLLSNYVENKRNAGELPI